MVPFAFSSILAFIQYILGSHYALFLLYFGLNLIDVISALIVAFSTKTYASGSLVLGALKKLGYWFVVAVAFALAFIFQNIGTTLGVDLSVLLLIGWFTLCLLLFHEIRSILLNLKKIGVKIPDILTNTLSLAEAEVEALAKKQLDGTMVVNTKDPDKDVFRMEFDGNLADLADKDVVTFRVTREE